MENHIYRWCFPKSMADWNVSLGWVLYGYAINRPCVMEDHMMEFFDLDEFAFNCESIIIDTSDDNQNSLYPNPNKGKFSYCFSDYSGGECDVSIMDITGVLMYSEKMQLIENSIKFDTKYLTSGVYVLHLTSEKFNYTSRFVIVK